MQNLKMVSYTRTDNRIDEHTGRLGHNALYSTVARMLKHNDADHVRVYRVAEKDGE